MALCANGKSGRRENGDDHLSQMWQPDRHHRAGSGRRNHLPLLRQSVPDHAPGSVTFSSSARSAPAAMGAVYLGKDITLNRVVAVKVLKPDLVADQKFLATFLREAEINRLAESPQHCAGLCLRPARGRLLHGGRIYFQGLAGRQDRRARPDHGTGGNSKSALRWRGGWNARSSAAA